MKTSHPIQKTRLLASAPKWAFAVALAVTSIFNPATSAVAQTVIMRSEPTRITIPKGFSATNTAAVTVVVSGLVTPGVDTVNLAITAIPSLPSGVGFTLSTNSFTNNGTMTATLTVTNDTTVSQGTFNVAVSATGAASYRLPLPIICAYTWGGTNFLNATSTNWTSGGNWLGGVAPSTTTDDVVIRDSGGVSAAAGATNIIISADTEIASLRFAQQTSATRSHNIELQSGATLKVTGAGGISLLKDPKNNTQAIDVKLAGNGRLVVSNAVANVANLINEQSLATLDMRNLNSFEAYVVLWSA